MKNHQLFILFPEYCNRDFSVEFLPGQFGVRQSHSKPEDHNKGPMFQSVRPCSWTISASAHSPLIDSIFYSTFIYFLKIFAKFFQIENNFHFR